MPRRIPPPPPLVPTPTTEPLRRIVLGIRALPPITLLEPEHLRPGAWCLTAPLWGNPLLPLDLLSPQFHPLRCIPNLATIHDLISTISIAAESLAAALLSPSQRHHITNRVSILALLQSARNLIPRSWLDAAMLMRGSLLPSAPSPPHSALTAILPHIGWIAENTPIRLDKLRVRDATDLQLLHVSARRRTEHLAFIAEATETTSTEPDPTPTTTSDLRHLHHLFESCWALPWENANKEAFWRLSVNGIRDGHRVSGRVCGCRHGPPNRRHQFWECAVAKAVTATIQTHLPPHTHPLRRSQIWLMNPPPQPLSPPTWKIICLAALSAMEKGRKSLIHLNCLLSSNLDDPPFSLSSSSSTPPEHRRRPRNPAHATRMAATSAVLEFWDRISDFAALGNLPDSSGNSFFQHSPTASPASSTPTQPPPSPPPPQPP